MFKKFQEKISHLLEDMAANSVGGGAFGPAAAEGGTFDTTPVRYDMALFGGVKPSKGGRKKKHKKGGKGWKKTPKNIIRRPINIIAQEL
jgi:hypothetical protein